MAAIIEVDNFHSCSSHGDQRVGECSVEVVFLPCNGGKITSTGLLLSSLLLSLDDVSSCLTGAASPGGVGNDRRLAEE